MKFLLTILFGLSLSVPTFADENVNEQDLNNNNQEVVTNDTNDVATFEVNFTETNKTDKELDALVRNFYYNFGPTRIFTTKSVRFFIRNSSFVPLRINSIRITGAAFSRTENCPEFLFIGQRCAVRIFFHPTRVRQYQGRLFINLTGQEDIRVFLYGRGVFGRIPL